MDVPAIAVTGASGLVGQRLLPLLAEHPEVARVVALDVREPDWRSRRVEFHRIDIAGTQLKPLLEGVDVVVHLAGVVDPILDEALMARVNVDGTRHVLAAAASVGARRFVRISSSTVYGAWPDNPVPLTEDMPLRPNPHFSPAVQGAEVERLIAEWRAEQPGVTVTTLRSAPVVGPGAERLPARILLGRPPLRVRGAAPPVQVVHVDDLAAALALVSTADLPGVYNVAADGWLDAGAARSLLPRTSAPAVPEDVLERALRRSWGLGLGEIPPGVVPYLVHPWVIANDRLKGAGWMPTRSNEEAIAEALDALPPRTSIRTRVIGGAVAVATLLAVVRIRRRRRAKRAHMVAADADA
ncbi:MAG TPA: NAD-dependent epimerase/dehydratase family protein [Acidimicrobiia bacterium]|nr:NAD-dependent epimerase/dehydratase family protein [Acidimicrobiia bacterium]